jgi:pyrroloquinoline quinone (PQQ) biosynthesis protein C
MNIQASGDFDISMLKTRLDEVWKELFRTSTFLTAVGAGETTRSLYASYLIETYHYTRHNARNQALVGVALPGDDPQYQRFCFQHAAEEAGHEQMALHDIKSLGIADLEAKLPEPLPETSVLTAYLYWISYQGNPVQRLGYSFWAESCYEYILPLMGQVIQALGLTSAQTTFFVAHADIDVAHAEMVNAMLARKCRTAADWAAASEVMETSLRLTGRMMDAVHEEHRRLMSGQSERCAFLRDL